MSGTRNYSLDLFRLLAMILVLAVHANYSSIGAPNQIEMLTNPISSILRVFNEQIYVICVNCFILISGYFGIHPKAEKMWSLVFQIAFWGIMIFIPFCLFGELSISCLKEDISSYWFIPAYFVLYILSPVLNAYIDTVEKNNFRTLLSLYFCFQLFFGWIVDWGSFNHGFSPISFVGLYLIAGYLRKYDSSITVSRLKLALVFIFSTLIPSIISCVGIWKFDNIVGWMINYNNPFVILSSATLLLLFSKVRVSDRYKNMILFCSSSCFAIYLIHAHPCVIGHYKAYMNTLFLEQSFIAYSFLVVLSIFTISIICICLDKIRIFCWNLIANNIWLEHLFYL